MLNRWLTALIGIPITLTIITINIWNNLPYFFLILIIDLIINIEIMLMTKNKASISYPFFGMSLCITFSCLLNYIFSMNIIDISYYFSGQIIIAMIAFYGIITRELFHAKDFSQNFENIGFTILIYISLVLFFPSTIFLKTAVFNSITVILLVSFAWFCDAAGLFSGMLWGKSTISALPSKSKTREGYIGSIIFTVLLGVILYYLQGILRFPFQWSIIKWITFGFMMSLSASFGDLTESLIKRWLGVKDSSNFMPGMGGIFDTVDSIIYSSPIVWFFFFII